ncbi:hypothetical protein PPERSA_12112 [Pseudocohnilembus persalinus]|uniref:Uncharacterized protein n=1 Tax=Pseudocohnilembus persalinus TaxID=266149 RepID=A0A0V0QNH7_PSEPJ|nr:hypothetical protein PPERSA_12112 [Pseudocohnilembus persalinus]|eukprot:KRX03907.1 hypothetical protein PPERSA_12112 [Pseudocohnilembus persalinus]
MQLISWYRDASFDKEYEKSFLQTIPQVYILDKNAQQFDDLEKEKLINQLQFQGDILDQQIALQFNIQKVDFINSSLDNYEAQIAVGKIQHKLLASIVTIGLTLLLAIYLIIIIAKK